MLSEHQRALHNERNRRYRATHKYTPAQLELARLRQKRYRDKNRGKIRARQRKGHDVFKHFNAFARMGVVSDSL